MTFLRTALTGLALLAGMPALAADGITISDAYARFLPGAKAGAAFMVIENTESRDDRLIGVTSDIAARTELHSHKADDDGVMQMKHLTEGVAVPAGSTHALERGGDHVMFMGLARRPVDGDEVSVTLSFEHAGDVVLAIPVDNQR